MYTVMFALDVLLQFSSNAIHICFHYQRCWQGQGLTEVNLDNERYLWLWR